MGKSSISLTQIKRPWEFDSHTASPDLCPPTPMFRYRQPLRRWAACVLFLWLFGIGAGIANACITTAPAAPVATVASHLVVSVAAHHDAVTHDHARVGIAGLPSYSAGASAHHGSLSKANCQDFCGKATVSIPPLKSALDDIQSHAVIVKTAVTVLPMPALAPVQWWVPRRDGVRGPSIPIAFLRLTL